jgi:hypothetical protein
MMKKKGFVLAIVSVALVALTGAAVALAWTSLWKTGTNTVKIGQPVQVSISGSFTGNDVLQPGETATATFAIDLTDAKFATHEYKLAIVGIEFDDKDLTYGENVPVWTYKFGDGGGFAALAENVFVALVEDGLVDKKTSVKLTLTLDENVPVGYAGAELTFILEIKETLKQA